MIREFGSDEGAETDEGPAFGGRADLQVLRFAQDDSGLHRGGSYAPTRSWTDLTSRFLLRSARMASAEAEAADIVVRYGTL